MPKQRKKVESRVKRIGESMLAPKAVPSRYAQLNAFLRKIDAFSKSTQAWRAPAMKSLADVEKARQEIQRMRNEIYALGKEGAKLYAGFEPVTGQISCKLDLNTVELHKLQLHKCLRLLDSYEPELRTAEYQLKKK